MADRSTLDRGVPLTEPFQKGGGFSGDHPDAAKFKDWVMDPLVRLPTGTWHLFANADGLDASDGPVFSLSAEITLVVSDDPAATPSTATPAPEIDEPVYGGDDIGDLQLQLKAGRSTYETGEPIDISTWYAWSSGLNDSIVVSHFEPEIAFSISQVADDVQVVRAKLYDSACQDQALRDGEHRDVQLTDHNVMSIRAVTWPPSSDAALSDDVLRLPIGRWRITADVDTALGPCAERGEGRQLHASIEIDVVGPENAEIELATGRVPTIADGTQMCLTARGGGVLTPNPRTGLGFTDKSGDVITDVIWPDGYTRDTRMAMRS